LSRRAYPPGIESYANHRPPKNRTLRRPARRKRGKESAVGTNAAFPEDIASRIDTLMETQSVETPSGQPRAARALLGAAPVKAAMNAGDPKVYEEMSSLYLQGYRETRTLKTRKGPTTHQLITKNALRILRDEGAQVASPLKRARLVSLSSGPDKSLKNMKLMMEGHFFGDNGTGKKGNYFPKYLNHATIAACKIVDDVNENAKTNFVRYAGHFDKKRKTRDLAWSLHYLQDMTAPHHVRNFPAYFTKRRKDEGFDTHMPFEHHANELFSKDEGQFDEAAKAEYLALLSAFPSLDESSIEAFAEHVQGTAVNLASDSIKREDHAEWDKVIKAAIPFAIACTMVFARAKLAQQKGK